MKKLIYLTIAVGLFACKKDSENPYETYRRVPPVVVNPTDTLDPNSFVGIHNNILRPTCANSGCHDGTFEPDYRTIESSYNTLVLQPIIKNDPQGTYSYRVVPGNANMSVLYQRLIKDIDGQSGIMPLVVEPGSDWNSKKAQYIENIKNWINAGAKDQLGNAPGSTNLIPTFAGVMGYADVQTTPIQRGGAGQGTIRIPFGTTSVTIYFSFADDETAPSSLTYNKYKICNNPSNFSAIAEKDLALISAISGPGYFTSSVNYTHKLTINVADYPVGEVQYIRTYVKDGNPTPTEIPAATSADYIQTYFSFVRL